MCYMRNVTNTNDGYRYPMKIQLLTINSFRHITNQEINFGEVFTVISGLNGCGKSSILGLIAHVFTHDAVSLTGTPMASQYSEIFRFCPNKDYDAEYSYNLTVEHEDGTTETKPALSRYIKGNDRYRIDVGDRHEKGNNKIKHPVIYLGLQRLVPMANIVNSGAYTIDPSPLIKKYTQNYETLVKNIFNITSDSETINTELVETKQKSFRGISTSQFSALGASAGQDNIGQIITSILSFRSLHDNNSREYEGGALLIDELECTLFPAAQINLIRELYKYAKALKLQIVFTTHSMDIIQFIESEYDDDSEIHFTETINNEVQIRTNPGMDYIKSKIHMIVSGGKLPKIPVNVLVEDVMAKQLLPKMLLGSTIKQSHQILPHVVGGDGVIQTIAKTSPQPFYHHFVLVPDGDLKGKIQAAKHKNILFFPGRQAPESFLYKYLKSLDDNHPLWNNSVVLLDKNACFNGFSTARSEKEHKKWLHNLEKMLNGTKLSFSKFLSNVITAWKKDNPLEHEEFLNAFTQACMFVTSQKN